jgi:hypothetical protein
MATLTLDPVKRLMTIELIKEGRQGICHLKIDDGKIDDDTFPDIEKVCGGRPVTLKVKPRWVKKQKDQMCVLQPIKLGTIQEAVKKRDAKEAASVRGATIH